jgi:hypothetical protein
MDYMKTAQDSRASMSFANSFLAAACRVLGDSIITNVILPSIGQVAYTMPEVRSWVYSDCSAPPSVALRRLTAAKPFL